MKWTSYLKKAEWIRKIGKDRLMILFIAGVLLLMIQTPAEKFSAGLLREKTKTQSRTEQNDSQASFSAGQKEDKAAEVQEGVRNGTDAQYTSSDIYAAEMENKLKQVLSKINGVGITEVIVTVETSAELVVEKDKPYSRDNVNETDAEGGSRTTSSMTDEESTVYWKDTDGNEIPFISKEINPKITGVLVVCQGGDREQIKKEITESLQALFDLDVHKIKVAKMNMK